MQSFVSFVVKFKYAKTTFSSSFICEPIRF